MIQRNKGNSLLAIPSDYTVVDLETTGFSSRYDSIIEVGCIKCRNFKEVDRYQMLIKPPVNIYPHIEFKTKITNAMVANAPKFEEVAQNVWDYLEGEIIVGHNIGNFDVNFLYDNFERTLGKELKNDFVDTLGLSRRLIQNLQFQGYDGYSLDNLCAYFNIQEDFPRHRAIGDCQCTNSLLICLKNFMQEKHINLEQSTGSRRRYSNIDEVLRNLQSKTDKPDEGHIFFDKCCVFTGALEILTRIDAAQIVTNIGGHCEDRITRRTNFLIVGDMNYRAGLEGYETTKLRKARQLIEQGQDLQIIPEITFYDFIEDYLNGE